MHNKMSLMTHVSHPRAVLQHTAESILNEHPSVLTVVQHISAITRKRLASKAIERLENSQAVLSDMKDNISMLQEHSKHCDALLEAEHESNAELQLSLSAAQQENTQLLERITSLETSVTSYDIKVHDLMGKVRGRHA
jgi:ACT domain-containing protein